MERSGKRPAKKGIGIKKFNFHHRTSSVMVNAGGISGVTQDLDDADRTMSPGAPDIGCYEAK